MVVFRAPFDECSTDSELVLSKGSTFLSNDILAFKIQCGKAAADEIAKGFATTHFSFHEFQLFDVHKTQIR